MAGPDRPDSGWVKKAAGNLASLDEKVAPGVSMSRAVSLLQILLLASFLSALGGCASSRGWAPSGGDRQRGVVRLSYEYPEFQQPEMSDAQAAKLAQNRCNAWGYRKAEPIEGQIRQCANVDDGNCNLWTVTREYQCTDGQGRYAVRLSR